ncbi:MAG: hypothetical protein WBP29_03855 [Candidatus Zixiibacteriota bacterium]
MSDKLEVRIQQTADSKKLNRFTFLSELIGILETGKIRLSDPTNWEDKNDALIFKSYMDRRATKVFAKCFSRVAETIYFWKAYSDGPEGCCIEFDKNLLKESLAAVGGVRFGDVVYRKIKKIGEDPADRDKVLFIKRDPYRHEFEFRVLWEGQTRSEYVELAFDVSAIRKITLSQQMPKRYFDIVKQLICDIHPSKNVIVNKSTVFLNRQWVKRLDSLTNPNPESQQNPTTAP